MFYIFSPMELYSDDVRKHKCAKSQGQGGIEVGSGRKKAGHKPDQIGHKDEKEDRGNIWEKEFSLWPGNLHHKIFKPTNNDFNDVLPFFGEKFDPSSKQDGTDDKNEHNKPHVCHL